MLDGLLGAPLIAGPLPTVIEVLGAVGVVVLLARRDRRWWTRTVPLILAIGSFGALAVSVVLAVVPLFPDPLPLRVLFWIGTGIAAITAGVLRAVSLRGRVLRTAVVVLAAVAVLGTCAVKVNSFYGYRTTLADALGLPDPDEVAFGAIAPEQPTFSVPSGVVVSDVWRAPPGLPATGRVALVDIPGTTSGFAARPGWVYLPPAYLTDTRPMLPVLVLVAGQPGGPDDWLLAGRLAAVMDRYAADHAGLAPIVVVPDATGAALADPLCLDSRLGNAETYLAVDVPAWARGNLQSQGVRAIGGFSYGGTCAVQLATRRPDVYPTFLDVSGQVEPTLGDRSRTVAAAFGEGADAQFTAVVPATLLATRRYPDSAGVFVVGADDGAYRPQVEQTAAAARAAGMDVTLSVLPGGHTWALAGDGLTAVLPLVARRSGLTR